MGNEHSQTFVAMPLNQLDKKQLQEVRRRSLSAGNLPVPLVEHLRQSSQALALPGMPSTTAAPRPRRRRSRTPGTVPARELQARAMVKGYLQVLEDSLQWTSVWCIVHEHTLHLYTTPTDQAAQDTVTLGGWGVEALPPSAGPEMGQHMFSLTHREYNPLIFRAETETEMMVWLGKLQEASQTVTIDGLNLEKGCSEQFDDEQARIQAAAVATERDWQQELLYLKKQQLLEEVLRQKEELELRQARAQGHATHEPSEARPIVRPSQPSPSHSTSDLSPSSSSPHLSQADKNIMDIVHLKQRKVSTQLKVDSVHRALQARQAKKSKKKGFKLPSTFSSKLIGERVGSSEDSIPGEVSMPTTEEQLQEQLSGLHRELEAINNDIFIKQSQQHLESGKNKQLMMSLPEKDIHVLRSRSSTYLGSMGRSSLSEEGSSKETSEKGSSDSLSRASGQASSKSKMTAQARKLAIAELVDFRRKTKSEASRHREGGLSGSTGNVPSHVNKGDSVRHSWSPQAFANANLYSEQTHEKPVTGNAKTSASPVTSHLAAEAKQDVQLRAVPRSLLRDNKKQRPLSSALCEPTPKVIQDKNQNDVTAKKRSEISKDAMDKIAAFEELLQGNLISQ